MLLSQNIEIEFKNIVTNQEFEKLKAHFQVKDSLFFIQKNYYFDTPDFALKKNGSALRIRKKGNQYELTLKQPHPDGLLETNEDLHADSVEEIIKGGRIENKFIRSLIAEMGINPDTLEYFGSLTTNRAELEYDKGLIVLDHNYYLNTEDYELEYEVTNRLDGHVMFTNLLTELKIPIRKTDNKIKRFYIQKLRLRTNDTTHYEG